MSSVPDSQRKVQPRWGFLLAWVVYWGGALVAYQCLAPADRVSCLFWLSGGIGLAATIHWGLWMSIPAFLTVFGFLYWNFAATLGLALIVALTSTVGVALGAWLFLQKRTTLLFFYRVADVGWFLGVGVSISSLVAIVGEALYLSSEGWTGSALWKQCFTCGLSGLALSAAFVPLLVFILAGEKEIKGHLKSYFKQIEAIAVVLLTLGLAWVVFFVLYGPQGQYTVMPYLLILPLLWAAARLPLFFAQSLSCVVLVFAFSAASTGQGALYVSASSVQLTNTALMALVQAVILLILGAWFWERREAENLAHNIRLSLTDKLAACTLQLAESESRLRLLADAAPFPMVMHRLADGHLIYVNQRAKALFGIPLLPLDPPRMQDFYANDQELNYIINCLTQNGVLKDYEIQLKNSQDQPFWALLSCSLVKVKQTHYVIAGINDITERKELEQTLQAANQALRQHLEEIEGLQQGLRDQALRDPLTGLFNRRYLNEILPKILAQSLALKQTLAVVMIDIDHFKPINDTYGHHGGDEVLSMLGSYLSDRFRSGDIVCRYGGEEFVIVLPDTSLDTAKSKAENLCHEISKRIFYANGKKIALTLSIGIAHSSRHGDDPLMLIHAADAALYAAKNHGRNQVVVAADQERLAKHSNMGIVTSHAFPFGESGSE